MEARERNSASTSCTERVVFRSRSARPRAGPPRVDRARDASRSHSCSAQGSIPSVGGGGLIQRLRARAPEEGDQLGTSRITACVAIAATALVAVGCGGDDNDTTTQATVTKSEYVHSVHRLFEGAARRREAFAAAVQELPGPQPDPAGTTEGRVRSTCGTQRHDAPGPY